MRVVALLAAVAGLLSVSAAVPLLRNEASFSAGSVLSGVADKAACLACRGAVATFKKAVLNNPTEAVIRGAALTLCVTAKLATVNVCKQIIPEFAPWIFDIISKYSAEDICIDFLNAPCTDKVPAFEVTFPKPKPANIPPPKRTGEKKYFLHFSDWHYDDKYTPGREAECGEPLCCRPPNKVGPGVKRPAGKWGDYNCDLHLPLGESMLRHAASVFPKIEFAVLTGDIPPHNVWETSQENVLSIEQTTADIFRKYFDAAGINVFPAMGNHESSPTNSFPPANVRSESAFWLYEALAKQWQPWLSEKAVDMVRQKGSYSIQPQKGLRVISVNTNMCYDSNWYLLLNRRVVDQDGILTWMISELQEAEDNNERVLIIGHISPGNVDCEVRWSQAYHQIIERYAHIISGTFFGHRHKDAFQIHYKYEPDFARTAENALVVAYIGPSVTTYTDMNPGYRVYEVDAGSFEVLNTYTYIADLSEQEKWVDDARWFLEYDTKSAYGNGTEGVLDAAFWHEVTERFLKGDRDLFNLYERFLVKSASQPICDDECAAGTICEIRSARRDTPCNFFNSFVEAIPSEDSC